MEWGEPPNDAKSVFNMFKTINYMVKPYKYWYQERPSGVIPSLDIDPPRITFRSHPDFSLSGVWAISFVILNVFAPEISPCREALECSVVLRAILLHH
jgi:hypothetical protein